MYYLSAIIWKGNKMEKICKNCGKNFIDKKHPNKKFCSRICFGSKIRIKPLSLNCEYCNNIFKPLTKDSRFCSKICSNRFNANKEGHWTFNITPEIHEMIEGILLSDGCLEILESNRYPRFVLTQGTGHKEYCEHVAEKLGFDKFSVKSRMIFNKKANKQFELNSFTTGSSPLWIEYYNRWYKDGKKIVPKDFKITPVSLLHCHLGDGSFYIKKRLNKTNDRFYTECKLTLSLMNFSIEEIEIINNQLKENDIYFHTRMIKQKGYERLYAIIDTSSMAESRKFFLYCASNPVRCYDYKFMNNEQFYEFKTRNIN